MILTYSKDDTSDSVESDMSEFAEVMRNYATPDTADSEVTETAATVLMFRDSDGYGGFSVVLPDGGMFTFVGAL